MVVTPRPVRRGAAAPAVREKQFRELESRGLLALPDPALAARYLNWLVLSIPLNEAMFDPGRTFSRRELDRYADEAVLVFLAA